MMSVMVVVVLMMMMMMKRKTVTEIKSFLAVRKRQ